VKTYQVKLVPDKEAGPETKIEIIHSSVIAVTGKVLQRGELMKMPRKGS